MEFAVKKESLRRKWQEKTTESQQERVITEMVAAGKEYWGES